MTPELAKRILERTTRYVMPAKLKTDILMDWLEGMRYADIMAKHKVSKTAVTNVVRDAKAEAKEVLEKLQ